MNDNTLPPITVNQPLSDSNDESMPSNAAAAELAPMEESNDLSKLESNLDEPNMADPLPTTENAIPTPVATPTPVTTAVAPNPIPPTNHTKNPKLVIGLLIAIILILTGIAGLLVYQNNMLKEQNAKMTTEIKAVASPTPEATPKVEPTTKVIIEENSETEEASKTPEASEAANTASPSAQPDN